MARKHLLQEEEDPSIDLSSMIDCVFILLIFFIVTTVFVEERGLKVDKPDAAASPAQIENQENFIFEITADNKVMFHGKEIVFDDVTRHVKSRPSDSEAPVTIRAHEKSQHGTFVSVWDAAKRGGAQALSFTTVN